MRKSKSYTALFSLMFSLLITWLIIFGLNAITPAEGDHWTHMFVRRGIAPMLSLFFGIYSLMIIRHFAVNHGTVVPYFRLLFLFCLFPAGIALAFSTMTTRDFNTQAARVESKTTEENLPAMQEAHQREREKIRQPLTIGIGATLIDVAFLLTALKRSKKKSPLEG